MRTAIGHALKMGLAHREWGRGRRLVLAHGFTQNADCWGPFAHDLASDHQIVAVDLPGHGDTAADHDDADLPESGRLLGEVGGNGVYVGYSMGGRVALHTALHTALHREVQPPGLAEDLAPGLVDGLVLIGSTAGIDDADVRRTRRQADEALADQLLALGLSDFLDRWLVNPLFAGLNEKTACRSERMRNRASGLAASLRSCGTGTQEPLWPQLASLDIPVLVLVGDDDAKFTEIGRRLVDALPRGELRTLPATHAVHLECPTSAAEAVRAFVEHHWPDDFVLS